MTASRLSPVTVEQLREALPRTVSDWARGIARAALDDIEDEITDQQAYYLARWFDAMRSLAQCEQVALWMIREGYATGHGDTLADLLGELVHQVHANALLEAHNAPVEQQPVPLEAALFSFNAALEKWLDDSDARLRDFSPLRDWRAVVSILATRERVS